MVNRPAGGARSVRHKREPYDWYKEGPRPVEQLFDAIDFGDDLIWDPSCGSGNILDIAKKRGHPTFGCDIIDRHARHPFKRGDYLRMERGPQAPADRSISVVNNPPYGYVPGIAEAFIRRTLEHHLTVRRAAFLVPIAFLCSDTRWRLFSVDHMPSHVCILSERPTMPPGSMVDQYTTYDGGMADYVWIVFTRPHRWKTQMLWLKPTAREIGATLPKRTS